MTDKPDLELIQQLLEIYDQKAIAEFLNEVSPDRWCRETLNRWVKGKATPKLTHSEYITLKELLPTPRITEKNCEFKFIDLFAGIGGIRKGFEDAGGLCVLTSEWNKYAVKTYKANHGSDESIHKFNEDIRQITLSEDESISDEEAYKHIEKEIPEYDVLLAGFPCQPFSIAGVSKKNAMGREHGFECKTQGTLFFDVA